MTIRDTLRHRHDLGLARAEVAAAVGVSAGTVSNVLERASAAGLTWPLPPDLDDAALHAWLYPPSARNGGHVQPDWDEVLDALQKVPDRRRARLTRRQLWVEYRDEVLAQGGTAYCYIQFCARLKTKLKSRSGPAQMRFDYAPGLYGMADFSGKTLALRVDRGEHDVEIFVAVLPHSSLIYAKAVPDQTLRNWTMANRRALEYFRGVPRHWIIDNLKAGVDKPGREEFRLNPTFAAFGFHHGNGWEDAGGFIRYDECVADDPTLMTESMRGLMRGELDREFQEHCTRFTLYPGGRAEVEATGEEAEFPRIAPAVTGRRNRYVYMLGVSSQGSGIWRLRRAVKRDLKAGTSDVFDYGPGVIAEEHGFVPRPAAAQREDDGWLVGPFLDHTRGLTGLAVFDARHVADGPVARAWLEYPLPLAFHGQFSPA